MVRKGGSYKQEHRQTQTQQTNVMEAVTGQSHCLVMRNVRISLPVLLSDEGTCQVGYQGKGRCNKINRGTNLVDKRNRDIDKMGNRQKG